MIEALWAVYFVAPNQGDSGAGVVVLENGTIRGGDSSYYYVGDFRVKEETLLIANVSVNHYDGALNNIFGPVKKINVVLTGNISYEEFTLTGNSVETRQPVIVKFKRIAEISA